MRTDIHSPSNFDPAQYTYVGSFDNFPEPGAFISNKWSDFETPFGPINALNWNHAEYTAGHKLLEERGAKIHFTDFASQCDHCGAHIRYVSVYRHISGECIAVGDICAAERFGCADRRAFDIKRLREAAASERESAKVFGKAVDFIREAAPELEQWMLSPAAADVDPIFADISRKLARWGSISTAQVDFARSLLQQHFERIRNGGKTDRELQFEREHEAAADCPTGRVKITGKVLKSEWRDDGFGGERQVMTVKDDSGFAVWGTCPSVINAERGMRIEFSAVVEPSDTDSKFGFFKRPTKAQVLAESPEHRPTRQEIADQVTAEVHERFPVITAENFAEADTFREQRLSGKERR